MIWSKAYRHTTADSVAALSLCEANVLEAGQRESIFYKFGRLLLREDFFSSAPDAGLYERSSAVVRLMTGKSPVYWQAMRLFARRVPICSAATAILLKNNIRAVYPQHGLTLKVSNPHDGASTDRIVNEATNRKVIKDAGGFIVPRIIQSRKVAKAAYILENLLENHRPFAASDVDSSFVSGFVKFQIANQTKEFAQTDKFDPVLEIGKFEALASVTNLNISLRLRSFLKTAVEKTALSAPISLCHGDLSRSNILVSNKQFAIIDWEFSRAAPAASDAVRLATQFPGFAEAYINELRHPDARAGFVLGCVHAANAHAERLHGLAVNRHQHMATRKTARKIAEIISLADRLAVRET